MRIRFDSEQLYRHYFYEIDGRIDISFFDKLFYGDIIEAAKKFAKQVPEEEKYEMNEYISRKDMTEQLANFIIADVFGGYPNVTVEERIETWNIDPAPAQIVVSFVHSDVPVNTWYIKIKSAKETIPYYVTFHVGRDTKNMTCVTRNMIRKLEPRIQDIIDGTISLSLAELDRKAALMSDEESYSDSVTFHKDLKTLIFLRDTFKKMVEDTEKMMEQVTLFRY